MADVNNKIRLQIVTQLDAAGIKATKDQVDQLELGLRRAGNSASGSGEKFGALEKALGKLPGKIGEIGGKLTGLAGQFTMVAGAFSVGVEIGNKIVDFEKKLGILKDPIEELKKENAEYNRQLQRVKESLAEVVAEENKRMDASAAASEKSIKAIDDQTAAYFRQAASIKGLRDAQGNAELMQLERDKFEEMRAYSDAGYTDAAEQIGRYYDVLVEELKAKQQVAEFDRESARLDAERAKSEEVFASAANRAAAAKSKQRQAEADLQEFRDKNSVMGLYRYSEDAERDDALEKIAERAKKDADRADDIMRKRAEKLENVDAAVVQRNMERANLVAAGSLSVDRAAAAYDDYASSMGNPGNFDVDPSWSAELLKNAQDAYIVQRDLLSVVSDFGDRLERLLEVK